MYLIREYIGGKPKPSLFTVCSITQGDFKASQRVLLTFRSNDTIAIYKALGGLLGALVSLPYFVHDLFFLPQ